MPCFRGIDISVVTETEPRSLPEFPHPDGSSIHLISPGEGDLDPSQQKSGPPSVLSLCSETESVRLQKAQPTISVYVPSISGAQFWLRYKIERVPEPAKILYFKMFMNSRNVTNWGVDLREQTSGAVVRALYEPCQRWQHIENGKPQSFKGIEARTFHFSYNGDTRSIADDGGLIEILVFRARSRHSRATKLKPFRDQDGYGIISPSGGLLENPAEAAYYEYHLIDPRDSPYGTFRFYYRSWRNLTELNLISPRDIAHHSALLRSLSLQGGPNPAEEGEDEYYDSDEEIRRPSTEFDFGFEREEEDTPVAPRKRQVVPVSSPATTIVVANPATPLLQRKPAIISSRMIRDQQRASNSVKLKENAAQAPRIFPPRTSSMANPLLSSPLQLPRTSSTASPVFSSLSCTDSSAVPRPLCISKSPPKNRLRTPPRLTKPEPPSRHHALPQPSKILRDRCLEHIENDNEDEEEDVHIPQRHHRRAVSASSFDSLRFAPSIAPSLLLSLDEDADGNGDDVRGSAAAGQDDVQYGVAKKVALVRDTSQSAFVYVTDPANTIHRTQAAAESDSPSDYNTSLRSSDTSSSSPCRRLGGGAAAARSRRDFSLVLRYNEAEDDCDKTPVAPRRGPIVPLRYVGGGNRREGGEEEEEEEETAVLPKLKIKTAEPKAEEESSFEQTWSSSQTFGPDDFF